MVFVPTIDVEMVFIILLGNEQISSYEKKYSPYVPVLFSMKFLVLNGL